jgi:hypothetical protein
LVVAGNANITGTLYKGTSAYNNPDIAEMMQSTQSLEEGDIVIVDPNSYNQVIKSNAKYQTAVGVVSPNATMVIADWKGGFLGEKIAMFGRVMVKVTDENGLIKAGDLLTTSSKEGHAMKCLNREECHYEIVGVAMQNQVLPNDKLLMVIKR